MGTNDNPYYSVTEKLVPANAGVAFAKVKKLFLLKLKPHGVIIQKRNDVRI